MSDSSGAALGRRVRTTATIVVLLLLAVSLAAAAAQPVEKVLPAPLSVDVGQSRHDVGQDGSGQVIE